MSSGARFCVKLLFSHVSKHTVPSSWIVNQSQTLYSFETAGTTDAMTWCHIPEALNFQQRLEYPKSWNLNVSLESITLRYVSDKKIWLSVSGLMLHWMVKHNKSYWSVQSWCRASHAANASLTIDVLIGTIPLCFAIW
jgi:hypothetical protein